MISVLLPTYNCASTVVNSIESILNQTFREFELLVLDDGSTDNTESIVSQRKDARMRYIKLPHRGLSDTLNVGLRQARFDIVARMDAGDISAPSRLGKQYQFILTKKINAVVACRYAVFEGKSIRYVVNPSDQNSTVRKRLALHPDFAHSGVMFYKKFVIENGSYKNIAIEDYELWLRLKNKTDFFILNEILLFVENAEGRLSTADPVKKYANHYVLQESYYKDLKSEFGIEGKQEEICYRGWREYFYGDKAQARKIWTMLGFSLLVHPRIMMAWCVTYLSESLFTKYKESRMKFRLDYYLNYFSKTTRKNRRLFASLVREGQQ